MKFRVTTSKLVVSVFEVEAKNENAAKDSFDKNYSFMYSELVSTKTINQRIVGVEKIE